MATACKSDRIYVWDCKAKTEIAFAAFAGEQAVACAFSTDGRRLAVGTVSGARLTCSTDTLNLQASRRTRSLALNTLCHSVCPPSAQA
jgi:hypothetical protein